MRMISNWKAVATRAHSMWAFYLGIIALVAPEVWFGFMGYDIVHPRVPWLAGLGFIIYGIVGRLKDQGIDR